MPSRLLDDAFLCRCFSLSMLLMLLSPKETYAVNEETDSCARSHYNHQLEWLFSHLLSTSSFTSLALSLLVISLLAVVSFRDCS